MNKAQQRIVQDYKSELRRSLKQLPQTRRDEIQRDIEEHIDQALKEAEPLDDVEVRNVLERIGDPQEIAAGAAEEGMGPPAKVGHSHREKRIRDWAGEAKWFFAGVAVTVGVLMGFFSLFFLPLLLFGLVKALSFSIRKLPGAWAFFTGGGMTTTFFYGIDLISPRGPCPYSTTTFATEAGRVADCGPPDLLMIPLVALGVTVASLVIGITLTSLRRSRNSP